MSFDDEDPEVERDLVLRSSSQRDSKRSRGEGIYAWTQPDIVERWPCRGAEKGCTAMVEITQEVLDGLAAFDREIARRGEAKLLRSQLVWCRSCRGQIMAIRAEKLRERCGAMAALIRELRLGCDVIREREITDQLTRWGHPDVQGLVRSIQERRSGGGKRREL